MWGAACMSLLYSPRPSCFRMLHYLWICRWKITNLWSSYECFVQIVSIYTRNVFDVQSTIILDPIAEITYFIWLKFFFKTNAGLNCLLHRTTLNKVRKGVSNRRVQISNRNTRYLSYYLCPVKNKSRLSPHTSFKLSLYFCSPNCPSLIMEHM